MVIAITVEPDRGQSIDVEQVLHAIMDEFRLSAVTSEDSYAQQIKRIIKTANDLKNQENTIINTAIFINDVDSRRKAFGRSIDISLSDDGIECFSGRISEKMIRLETVCSLPSPFHTRVLEFIRSLSVGQVRATW